jgi:hypothetical protein
MTTSGLNKKELARRIQTRAHAKGLMHVSTAASRVRGWLAGQQPGEAEIAQIIAEVLTEACGRPLTIDDLGFQSRQPLLAANPANLAVIPKLALANAIESQSSSDLMLTSYDLRTERTGISSGEELLDAVEHVALGRPTPLPDPASNFRIQPHHVTGTTSLAVACGARPPSGN